MKYLIVFGLTLLFIDMLKSGYVYSYCRTKEQLGYVVECSPRITYRVFGFCFCVQSAEYSPIYLQERIENFINGLEELLVSIQVYDLVWISFFLLCILPFPSIFWVITCFATFYSEVVCCVISNQCFYLDLPWTFDKF